VFLALSLIYSYRFYCTILVDTADQWLTSTDHPSAAPLIDFKQLGSQYHFQTGWYRSWSAFLRTYAQRLSSRSRRHSFLQYINWFGSVWKAIGSPFSYLVRTGSLASSSPSSTGVWRSWRTMGDESVGYPQWRSAFLPSGSYDIAFLALGLPVFIIGLLTLGLTPFPRDDTCLADPLLI
jgi:hypothetical protein